MDIISEFNVESVIEKKNAVSDTAYIIYQIMASVISLSLNKHSLLLYFPAL